MEISELYPPPDLIEHAQVSGGDFVETGKLGASYLMHLGLKPHHRVLDPGCGIGRVAIPLTQYLDPDGSYAGFDVVREGIEWCARTITPRYPNFRFEHADVFSADYHPTGKILAKDYRFPYGDDEFDFAYLFSVFTHIEEAGFRQYLSELARVLKPGGTLLATFMLLSDDNIRLIDEAKSHLQPLHDCGNYRVVSREFPEATVAFREELVEELYHQHALEITELRHGNWASQEDPAAGGQDGIIAVKRG